MFYFNKEKHVVIGRFNEDCETYIRVYARKDKIFVDVLFRDLASLPVKTLNAIKQNKYCSPKTIKGKNLYVAIDKIFFDDDLISYILINAKGEELIATLPVYAAMVARGLIINKSN